MLVVLEILGAVVLAGVALTAIVTYVIQLLTRVSHPSTTCCPMCGTDRNRATDG